MQRRDVPVQVMLDRDEEQCLDELLRRRGRGVYRARAGLFRELLFREFVAAGIEIPRRHANRTEAEVNAA